MLYEVDRNNRERLTPLFAQMHDTMIRSCLEGHMGIAIADDLDDPTVAQIVVGDFVFLAGDVKSEAARKLLECIPLGKLVIAQNEQWKVQIEALYKERVVKVTRYAFKQDPKYLKCERLKILIGGLAEEYELKRMEGDILKNASLHALSEDFTAQFDSLEDFEKRGRGYCILYKGQVVCGASSYSIYNGGLEIEVDTHPSHRRKGLATVATAALILECLEGGIYPSYDAANLASVGVAQKLGYQLERPYDTYIINEKL